MSVSNPRSETCPFLGSITHGLKHVRFGWDGLDGLPLCVQKPLLDLERSKLQGQCTHNCWNRPRLYRDNSTSAFHWRQAQALPQWTIPKHLTNSYASRALRSGTHFSALMIPKISDQRVSNIQRKCSDKVSILQWLEVYNATEWIAKSSPDVGVEPLKVPDTKD